MTELEEQTVLLTRAEEDNEAWAERLAAVGARPIALPCIRTEVIDSPELRAALAEALTDADWLVFTSRRGVEAFATLHESALLPDMRVAVVGAATAAAANDNVGRVDLTSEAGTAASLGRSLAERVAPGTRVVVAVAENAGSTLPEALQAAGATCTRLNLYRTVAAPPAAKKHTLSALGADNVLLASPSAVTGFINQVDMDISADIFTIGPSTTAAAQAAGLTVEAQAEYPSLEGLMEAMRWAD